MMAAKFIKTHDSQGCNFNAFLRGVSSFPCENFVFDPFLVIVVDQMVLGKVRCPTKIDCTTIFAL